MADCTYGLSMEGVLDLCNGAVSETLQSNIIITAAGYMKVT